jgi:hypothetical protein
MLEGIVTMMQVAAIFLMAWGAYLAVYSED